MVGPSMSSVLLGAVVRFIEYAKLPDIKSWRSIVKTSSAVCVIEADV